MLVGGLREPLADFPEDSNDPHEALGLTAGTR